MGGFLAGLVSIAGSLTVRVLLSLGFSVVTITGVAAGMSTIKNQIISFFGSAPGPVLQLAGLFGCWDALGMIFGGITFAVTYSTITAGVRLAGAGGT